MHNCAFSLHQDTKIKPIPVPRNIPCVTWFKKGGRWACINEKEEVREKLCLTRSMSGHSTAS